VRSLVPVSGTSYRTFELAPRLDPAMPLPLPNVSE
jgi:hypothetical protein